MIQRQPPRKTVRQIINKLTDMKACFRLTMGVPVIAAFANRLPDRISGRWFSGESAQVSYQVQKPAKNTDLPGLGNAKGLLREKGRPAGQDFPPWRPPAELLPQKKANPLSVLPAQLHVIQKQGQIRIFQKSFVPRKI